MFKTAKILISEIDINDETYKISSDMDLTALSRSIMETGLLNPPLVKKNRDSWVIVSGFRRIKAMIQNKMIETRVKIIPDGKIPDENTISPDQNVPSLDENGTPPDQKVSSGKAVDARAALMAVTENAFHRPLDIMEQARGIVLLSQFMNEREIAAKAMWIFNSKMNPSLVKRLFSLGLMPEGIHCLMEANDLSMTSALKLNTYDAETMKAFIFLFTTVKLGLNKQMEIITNIHEIAAREDISAVDVIKSNDIENIMTDETMDRSRKGSLLRSCLLKRRYPNIKAREEKFKTDVKQLKLANELKLEAPVNFEAMDYTFSFQFKNCNELDKRIEKLSDVSRQRVLRQMIS